MVQLNNLKRLIKELRILSYRYGSTSDSLASFKERAKVIVARLLPNSEYLRRIDNTPTESYFDFALKGDVFNEKKAALIGLLELIVDDIEMNAQSSVSNHSNELATSDQSNFDKVFIVHGHDDLAKTEVARFIENLGFEPIILHEQASGGKTIIEKIEKHTDVGFGIVLYTPCDEGGKLGQTDTLQPRARQNVLLEHGYLMGRIGRDKVCALVKGDVERPSDISGIVYVEMDARKAWHRDVAKELEAAGYIIDGKKLLRL